MIDKYDMKIVNEEQEICKGSRGKYIRAIL